MMQEMETGVVVKKKGKALRSKFRSPKRVKLVQHNNEEEGQRAEVVKLKVSQGGKEQDLIQNEQRVKQLKSRPYVP